MRRSACREFHKGGALAIDKLIEESAPPQLKTKFLTIIRFKGIWVEGVNVFETLCLNFRAHTQKCERSELMTSFLYLGLRRFHRVFVFRTSKQNIMADPKARTDIKAEMKTEPLDSQDTKSVQDLTIFVSSDFVHASDTALYSPGIRPTFIFADVVSTYLHFHRPIISHWTQR